jgi:hypothetical protein
MPGIRAIAVALVIAVLSSGCAVTDPVPVEVVTIEVAHHTAPCTALMPRDCLLVRWEGQTEWGLFYSDIQGFTWEPGFTYTLRVALHPIANPPQDSSSVEYSLVHVLAKVPVQN